MAFQPETPVWENGVFQLETTTPVQGGVGGVSNSPLLHLSNRTAYLKQHVDALESAFSGLAPINGPAFTGSPTAPNVTAGDSSTKIANTAFVQNAVGGILFKNVAGNSNVTLTAAECGNAIIFLSGALTGSINVIVPSGAGKSDEWVFHNGTTGNFTVTVKTAAGAGVLITQAQSYVLYCDQTDVRAAGAANQNSFTWQKFVATAGQTLFTTPYTPGNIAVFRNGAFLIPIDDYAATNGINVVLSVGAVVGDEVVVMKFSSFETSGAVPFTGGAMLGLLELFNGSTAPLQAVTDDSTKLANTAFVRDLMQLYGLAGRTKTTAEVGVALGTDLNLMTGEISGTFTLSGAYDNGPLANGTIYSGLLRLTRRAFDAGMSVVQEVWAFGDYYWRYIELDGSTFGPWNRVSSLRELTGTNQSLTTNGYQKLPGGVILQWGQGNTGSGTTAAVTFPIAFPTALRATVAMNLGGAISFGTAAQSASGVTYSSSAVAGLFNWFAIGN